MVAIRDVGRMGAKEGREQVGVAGPKRGGSEARRDGLAVSRALSATGRTEGEAEPLRGLGLSSLRTRELGEPAGREAAGREQDSGGGSPGRGWGSFEPRPVSREVREQVGQTVRSLAGRAGSEAGSTVGKRLGLVRASACLRSGARLAGTSDETRLALMVTGGSSFADGRTEAARNLADRCELIAEAFIGARAVLAAAGADDTKTQSLRHPHVGTSPAGKHEQTKQSAAAAGDPEQPQAEAGDVRCGARPGESTACPFCDYAGPSPIRHSWAGGKVIAFEPLNPVTPGHLLVVPAEHVEHFGVDVELSALVMRCAASLVKTEMMPTAHSYFRTDLGANIITSAGESATQTVKHLHVHFVPRRRGDGLLLPWSEAAAGGSPTALPGKEPHEG